MTDIDIICDDRIDSRELTPHSLDDENRKELPWEKREESLILKWGDDCNIRSVKHDIKGKKFKIKFAMFGIPSIFIPIILSGVSPIVGCHSIVYSLGMMSAGLFSGVNVFFNFGKKQQEHFDYSNKFSELFNEIESELSKPKRFRVACDIYIERVKSEYNALCNKAPII